MEPLPGGSGIEFVDEVVGGACPGSSSRPSRSGVRAQAAKGVAAGHPLIDVRVTLRDGKAHPVDFLRRRLPDGRRAGAAGGRAQARIHLLEPVAEVSVLVGDDYVGAVMSDLSGRRGKVLGTEQTSGGRTLIRAEVPEIEIGRYAVDLRSLTHWHRALRPPLRAARTDAAADRGTPPGGAAGGVPGVRGRGPARTSSVPVARSTPRREEAR